MTKLLALIGLLAIVSVIAAAIFFFGGFYNVAEAASGARGCRGGIAGAKPSVQRLAEPKAESLAGEPPTKFYAQLWCCHKWSEARLRRSITPFAQRNCATAGRQSLHLRYGHALLLDPLDAGPAPFGEAGEGSLERCARVQLLGHHARILHRHAAALAQHRRAGVRGVTDQHNSAAVNFFDRHPLHGRADDLVVALERGIRSQNRVFQQPARVRCGAPTRPESEVVRT